MGYKIYLSREQILDAMSKTNSGFSCARYLGINWHTLRQYAEMYKTDDGTMTLRDAMKNPAGKGIPKFKKDGKKQAILLDIIEGRVGVESYDPIRIKHRLIEEGYLKEECALCGFHERRVIDYRMPLLLNHKNNNKKDFKLDNIELLCLNCFFLTIGDYLTPQDQMAVETPINAYKTTDAIKWDLDDYHLQRLKELGLGEDDKEEDDPNEFVSRKY